ncbi:Type I restriction modification DNA specificity domain-containing protein [Alcanivorax sp. DSM 26293]|nr:Type I restriction modification DNA specificity domain-containing protein [Alcanivorax sp. DSM 26293]
MVSGLMVKLSQIASINPGYPFRGKIEESGDGSIVAVQMKDVSLTTGVIWSGCTPTTLIGKRHPQLLGNGDILVAARGNRNYAVEVTKDKLAPGVEAVAAPHFFVVTLKTGRVIPPFLAWLLNQNPSQRYFEKNAEGTLTKSIRRSVLENTPLAFPDKPRQKAIMELVHTMQQEQQLMEQLQRKNQSLMNAIASDILRPSIQAKKAH